MMVGIILVNSTAAFNTGVDGIPLDAVNDGAMDIRTTNG
jgi:hypothetical protein